MKEIDFYGLPRTVQDRVLASLVDRFDPKPILSLRGGRGLPYAWLAVTGVAAALLAALWWVGYGDAGSSLARHPLALGMAYLLLAGAIAAGALQLLSYGAALKTLPFPAGIYLFPTRLIDARRRKLQVYPLEKLTDVSAGGPETVVVRFGETSFTFPIKALEREAMVERIQEARRALLQGIDDAERQRLDPLVPPAVASPLASEVPLADRRPWWVRARWLLAAAIALAGIPLYVLRDQMSDARMFAAAQQRDEVAGYEQYLNRGTAHRTAVARVLLPRAALRSAVAAGTVDAILQFRQSYPDTDIQQEIDQALRSALDAAFASAKKEGTLAALVDFAERYPDHGLAEPLAKARHAIYERALERLQAKVPPTSKRVATFAPSFMAALERAGARKTASGVRGPTVAVRMRRVPSQALDGADDLVRRNPWFAGDVSFPSRYLDAAHVTPHERKAGKALAEVFAKEFDPEIATFAAGDPLDGSSSELPTVKVPTLIVSYRVEPSGRGYASKKPRCVFVGLVFFFEMAILLPGEATPLVLGLTTSLPMPTRIIADHDEAAPRGSLETAVYEAMLERGFAEGKKRYAAVWFGAST